MVLAALENCDGAVARIRSSTQRNDASRSASSTVGEDDVVVDATPPVWKCLIRWCQLYRRLPHSPKW